MGKKNKKIGTLLLSTIVPVAIEAIEKVITQKTESERPMTKEEYKIEKRKTQNAAKQIRLETKHKQKMELLEEKNKFKQDNIEEIEQKKFKITCLILFFAYGIATISATQDLKLISTITGLAQVVMIELPILSEEGVLSISEKTQKTLFYTSILLIIPFTSFRN